MKRLKKFWLLGLLALFVAVSASSASAVTLTIPNTSGSGTISIPVNIDNATGLAGFTFRITYNPAVLTPIVLKSVVVGTLTTGWTVIGNTSTSGVVQGGGFSGTELTGGSGSLVNIKFTVIGAPGTTSAVNFTAASLSTLGDDVTPPATIPSTTVNGTFTVPVAPVKVLSVAPADRPVAFAANTTTFAVSNTGTGTMAWTAAVTTGGTWLSITSGGSGSNSGTITAAFTKNATGSARTGTITVTATGATGSPKAVTVTQAAEGTPLVFNLKLYTQAGTEITGDVLVDTPIKAKGVLSGDDGSALAISQWMVNARPVADTIFVDTTNSGNLDSAWLPANLLEPGMAYTLRGRAKNASGVWSAWATLDFNTILQAAAADADGDGVPDDQAPTDTFVQQPDTKTIKFNRNLIQADATSGDTITYFAGIARTLEAPPLSGTNSYGVFTTRIEVPVAGHTSFLTYTFPETLPSGTEWYKYDESAPAGSKWSKYPDALIGITGKTVTVEVKDGGKGDADGVANRTTLDPAGPVVIPASDDGDSGSLPVGPLAVGISALLVWFKRRKQR